MSKVELTGALAWIFNVCFLTVAASIIVLGTWIILNFFIWDILVQYSLRSLRIYGIFYHFIKYHKRYLKWAKKYEGKLEETANEY